VEVRLRLQIKKVTLKLLPPAKVEAVVPSLRLKALKTVRRPRDLKLLSPPPDVVVEAGKMPPRKMVRRPTDPRLPLLKVAEAVVAVEVEVAAEVDRTAIVKKTVRRGRLVTESPVNPVLRTPTLGSLNSTTRLSVRSMIPVSRLPPRLRSPPSPRKRTSSRLSPTRKIWKRNLTDSRTKLNSSRRKRMPKSRRSRSTEKAVLSARATPLLVDLSSLSSRSRRSSPRRSVASRTR